MVEFLSVRIDWEERNQKDQSFSRNSVAVSIRPHKSLREKDGF